MVLACLAVVATWLATACMAAQDGDDSEEHRYAPASLGPADPSGVRKVILTAEAARRIELATEAVEAGDRGVVVDYAALIYDQEGGSWVYVMSAPLTYHRTKVEVARIDGDRVTVSRGPAPGTRVVTQGATQVYGAELEMDGSH